MGFNIKKSLKSGTLGSIVAGPAGFGVGTALGAKGWDPLSPKRSTQDQVPLETPEQSAARRKLYDYMNSGVFGDFKAGAEIPVQYGDYSMTPYEQQGQTQLGDLLSSGIPDQYRLGDAAVKDLLDTSPAGLEAMFNPFKDIVTRNTREASDAVKRNAAFSGNLYSTNTIRGLGDVEARGNETMAAELARLTEGALNRKLNAVPLAYKSAADQENLRMGRIGASQEFGSLARNLNNAKVAERNAELLRRRQELQLPIQAAGTVLGSTPNYGVPSVTTSEPSTLMQLLQIGLPAAGQYFGAKAGGRI